MSLSDRLKNKAILITAAAAGIGRASAIRMAREGARVIGVDIDRAGLRTLVEEAAIETYPLDVANLDAINRLVAHIPVVDVLFNGVGIVPAGTILDCSVGDWERTFAINVSSCFYMIKAYLPGMLRQGSGCIINVASIVSSLKGAPNRFCYGATKAAVIGITKSVAADFVGRGIRCNAICPGTVDTPSLRQRLSGTGNFEEALREFEARQPMGRLADVDEIAGLAAFLASNEASFITGQAYPVDGGWSI